MFAPANLNVTQNSAKNLRTATGFRYEMNLLLASLRRVEVRIEPQTITDFLKWKNRMADYNGGTMPEGVLPAERELNVFLAESRGRRLRLFCAQKPGWLARFCGASC